MTKLRIEGQHPLRGEVVVKGSKNSATAILAATLLTVRPCLLKNIPRIEDISRIVELLESVGAACTWRGPNELVIAATSVDASKINASAVRKLRASVLFMGALVGRTGGVRMPGPGGDQIGARPLDAHLTLFRELGIDVHDAGAEYELKTGIRRDVDVTMMEFSVTATENAVLASVLAEGVTTTLRCAAAEPSVQDLCWFLESLGARINGIGTHTLTIEGVRELSGSDGYTVMPDPVEAGTFMCLGAASRSSLRIIGVPTMLYAELNKFREANVRFGVEARRPEPGGKYDVADVVLRPSTHLRAVRNLHNMPYPGFYADLLQPFAVLLTQADGTSLVHDWMYEGRLRYVEELNKMGAEIFVADPHRILVTGPTNLHGADITSYDIRTGASLIIAALIASGTSTIGPIYQLDRGYERLDERLRSLGAVLTRFEA